MLKVELFDLSDAGAGVESGTPLPVGAIITLRVGIGALRLPRLAQVTRCTPNASGGYDIGIVFVNDVAGVIGGAFAKAV